MSDLPDAVDAGVVGDQADPFAAQGSRHVSEEDLDARNHACRGRRRRHRCRRAAQQHDARQESAQRQPVAGPCDGHPRTISDKSE